MGEGTKQFNIIRAGLHHSNGVLEKQLLSPVKRHCDGIHPPPLSKVRKSMEFRRPQGLL